MAFYTKSDMVYSDYSWTAHSNDDPKITGAPDNTLLNRNEGYEVLYFINKMAEIHYLKNKKDGEKIEMMLREKVPSYLQSQGQIKWWIENNWNG